MSRPMIVSLDCSGMHDSAATLATKPFATLRHRLELSPTTMYTANSFSRTKSSPARARADLPPLSARATPPTGNNKPLPEDPHTPVGGERSSVWLDSAGSRTPLVQHAQGLDGVPEGSDSDSYQRTPRSPVTEMRTTRPSPLARASTSQDLSPRGPELKLPKSIHDDYVSSMLHPEASGSGTPPPIIRSTSAPNKNIVGRELFASSEDEVPGQTIRVHRAKLSEGGKELEDSLRVHLAQVLRVQKEIGRLHQDLEGISGIKGDDEVDVDKKIRDALHRREEGLDGIMDQLAVLSNVLRAYHAQGTPQLSFPQPSTKNTMSTEESTSTTSGPNSALLPAAVLPIVNPPTTSATLPPDFSTPKAEATPAPARPRPPVMRSSTTLETSSSQSSKVTPKKRSAWASVFGNAQPPPSVQSPMEMEAVDRKRPW